MNLAELNGKKFKKGDFVLTPNGESTMLIIDDMLGKSNDGDPLYDGTYQCAWLDNNQDLQIGYFKEDDLSITGNINLVE